MDVSALVSLGLLLALAIAAAFVIRRMTQIAAEERKLRAYVDGVARVTAAADAALDRGSTAVDGLLHGRGTTDTAADEVGRAAVELGEAQALLASLPTPDSLAEGNRDLMTALGSGRDALAGLQPSLGDLQPGRPADDPTRLEAGRATRRALLAAFEARDAVHIAERRIEACVATARARTSRRDRAAGR